MAQVRQIHIHRNSKALSLDGNVELENLGPGELFLADKGKNVWAKIMPGEKATVDLAGETLAKSRGGTLLLLRTTNG